MKVELGKISSIKQGVVLNRIKSKEEEPGELFPLLTIGRLLQEEEGIYEEEQNMISVSASKVSSLRFAKEGMILIGLTSFHRAVVLTKEQEGMVIPSNFLILEFLGGIVDAHYFAWYFNESPDIQKLKESIIHGTGKIKVLSIQQIRGIQIEFPDLVTQMVIGNLYALQLKKSRLWKQILRLEMKDLTSRMNQASARADGSLLPDNKLESYEEDSSVKLSSLYRELEEIRNQMNIYEKELSLSI